MTQNKEHVEVDAEAKEALASVLDGDNSITLADLLSEVAKTEGVDPV